MNFLKWLSIKTQLFILAISTGVLVTMIIAIIYVQVAGVITKNNNVFSSEMTFQIKQNISDNSSLMYRIMTGIAYNITVQDYVLENDRSKKVELFKKVNNFLLNMQGIHEGIVDFVFLSDSGNYYYLRGKNAKVQQIIEHAPRNAIKFFSSMEVLRYNDVNRNCFLLISTIYSIDTNRQLGERIGVAALVLDAGVLGVAMDNKFKDSSVKFYLVDRKQNVYSGSDPSLDGFALLKNPGQLATGENIITLDQEKLIVNKDEMPEIGGAIFSVIPQKKLFEDLYGVRRLVTTILIIFGVLLLGLFFVIINNILFPLRKLMAFISSVRAVKLDGLKQRINLGGYVEMGIVAGKFNGMLDEIDHLTQRLISTNSILYKTELGKQKSELAFLRSQINPHFLYNTLESLKGMAVDEGAMKTMSMAKALGQVFRYSVKGAAIVTLREELNIIKSYVQIQQIRFGERFDVFYDFPDNILECTIPKMMLQPIVENAISHGLESKMEKGHLWIGGKLTDHELLTIWVKDDGTGIGSETLESIHAVLSHTETLPGVEVNDIASIGLVNVHNRIQLTYGPEYGVEVISTAGEGTEVLFKIPIRRDGHV